MIPNQPLPLNKAYYQSLIDKYKSVPILKSTLSSNFSSLTLRIILEQTLKNQPIHINCPNNECSLFEVTKQLYIELSNNIFCKYVDFPTFKVGLKVRSREKKYGIEKPMLLIWEIKLISGENYKLECIDSKYYGLRMEKTYEELTKEFIPIIQNVRDKTLKKFYLFFDELNSKNIYDFTPTDFMKKSVFIAHKQLWDDLDVKNNIPSIYLPSPREESDHNEVKSIQAISDCIMYITTKYEVCYQQILKQGKKIDTIVLYNTEEEQIHQMLQDKQKYGFNIVILTNYNNPVKNDQIPCWNWFKEEIEIVNSL
jgi:hypothetical protein